MRARDLLPDHIDSMQTNGIQVRKGTVGAFLVNARSWLSADAESEAKLMAQLDILDALPALQALGLFDLMTINDIRLRLLVDNHIEVAERR
jgi:hypothetical protein